MAFASASVDANGVEETFSKGGVCRNEGDHQREQSDALDVLLEKQPLPCAIREVDHADQLIPVDEGKADERSGREVLVAQQRMASRVGHVLHEDGLARSGDAAGDPLPDRDAPPIENPRLQPS